MNFFSDKISTLISFLVNLFLVIIKFLSGIFGKSQTMIADAIHSLSDGIATIIVYISLNFSKKPADKNHPYGHGNIEVIVAIFVSFLIFLTGFFLGYSAIHSIIHKHYYDTIPEKFTIYIAILSIIVKELLYRYTYFVGKKLNSPMIIANAYDHRSDALSSVGALLAIIFARVAVPIMDPLGSIIISLFILKMGFEILKDNIFIIMDTVPSDKLQIEVNNLINTVKGVKSSYSTRIHPVGRHYFIETEIVVDKEITVEQAHNIAEEVKTLLKNSNNLIKDVIVHIEPKV